MSSEEGQRMNEPEKKLQIIVSQFHRIEQLEALLFTRNAELARVKAELESLTDRGNAELEGVIVAYVERTGRYPKSMSQLPAEVCASECHLKKTIETLKLRRRAPRRPLKGKEAVVDTSFSFSDG